MSETNIESYFVSDLPGVFIIKITLDIAGEKVAGTTFNKDPHIIQNATRDQFLVSSSEDDSLHVVVDFNLKTE